MAAPISQQVFDYLGRALSDDDLFAQLRELVSDSRQASRRVQRRGAGDQTAQRRAFAALSALPALVREAREPEPPPRHRLRRVVILAGAGAGAVLAYRSLNGGDPPAAPAPPAPAPPATPAPSV